MISEDQVREKLATHIEDNTLILETYPTGVRQTIEIPDFVSIVQNVPALTYTDLSSATLVISGESISPEQSGWQRFFDKWHEEGLI